MVRSAKSNGVSTSSIKKSPWTYIIVVGLVVVLFGSLTDWKFNLKGNTATPGAEAPSPTTYKLSVVDFADPSTIITEDVERQWYEYDASKMETDEIESLVFSDFTAISDDWELTPVAGYIYVINVSMTDRDPVFACTSNLVAEGKMQTLVLGENLIMMMNSTEDISMLAWNLNGFTVNQTDYREWTLRTACLDGSESSTANVTNSQGFKPYYDFEGGAYHYFVIRCAFNTTATAAFANLDTSYEFDETMVNTSGNYTFYEIDTAIWGQMDWNLKFGTGLGTTFEVLNIAVGLGNSASFTQLDVQA